MASTVPTQTRYNTWAEWFAPAKGLLPEVEKNLPGSNSWNPTDSDRQAAWALHVQLVTRISTAPLPQRDGVEAAALKSLYDLFTFARKLVEEKGLTSQHFALPTVRVLELVVRPFTGHWHGQQERGALARRDHCRRFRRELRELSQQLAAFATRLADLAGTTGLVLRPTQQSSALDHQQPLWPEDLLGPKPPDSCPPLDLRQELDRITARWKAAYSEEAARTFGGLGAANGKQGPLGLVGLALSGGGIRSATFCLGVLQGLTRHGLFEDIDYLSTVSGGGYLGAFLSANLNEEGTTARQLLVDPAGRTGDSDAVRHLRNHSKYLFGGGKDEILAVVRAFFKSLFRRQGGTAQHYRDRLASCYLAHNSDVVLSNLCQPGSAAPYPLINATVNLPGSDSDELRGRKSDFFVMTPDHCGSVLTGYCKTSALEESSKGFDLASAIAISGAAVSSHSGANTRTAQTAVLAALDFSLGRWLPNPTHLATGKKPNKASRLRLRTQELLGKLNEKQDHVHVSDGGHIDNLGIYELLRRRCKLIVAVDGECDEDLGCRALITAARFAAIDLGVRLEIDLSTLALDNQRFSQAHFAFGTIDYGAGEKGYLLYLKSSVTGNETAYIAEYRARHPKFPHETTMDQLFDEDQFEAYRALGEHIASDLFGEDLVTLKELSTKPHKSRTWLEALIRELLPPEPVECSPLLGGTSS